jgi:hypothetical protein
MAEELTPQQFIENEHKTKKVRNTEHAEFFDSEVFLYLGTLTLDFFQSWHYAIVPACTYYYY